MMLHAAAEIRSRLRGFPDVHPDSGAVGLHSRTAIYSTDPVRWCNAHQVWKLRVRTITSTVRKLPFHDDCAIFQYFTESPSPFTKWKGGLQSRVCMSIQRRWVPITDLVRG
jgi:hypothetical protein